MSDTPPPLSGSAEAGSSIRPVRPLALVGMMGAGKSTIGRRLAARLQLPFKDSDQEIELAAGCSVADLFERIGEAAFREGERRVIDRLLDGKPLVLATGGGAFVQAQTRALIQARATTIWLHADLDTLVERTGRRDTRPLLRQGDPRATLARLMRDRDPAYAQADVHVASHDGPHTAVVADILARLAALQGEQV
ncbi:MAG: shikimate kinase [Rhodothalassiaceae bacterium]